MRCKGSTPVRSDREYLGALREAAGEVPEDQVDWEAFNAQLAARAELHLARLRGQRGASRDLPRRLASANPLQMRRRLPAPERTPHRTPSWWECVAH